MVAEHGVVRRLVEAVPVRAGPALVEGVALALLIVSLTAAAAGVVLVMIRTGTGFAVVDLPVAEWAAREATPTSTTIMRELSRFGGYEYVLLATLVTCVLAWGRDRRWAIVGFVVTAMLGQFLLSNSIKWSVDRTRPALANLTGYSGTSFPSGHAVAAAAVWASVAFLLGRGRSRRVRGALFGVAVALGVIVAGTRVALGVHWTTDVVIGTLIGWAWFAVCAVLFGGRRLRPGAPMLDAAGTD
jgi:undecaprenyl-diphosphatase